VRTRLVLALVVALAATACYHPPHDYDGDLRADLVWIDTATGTWYRGWPGTAEVLYRGAADDVPVPADYDGDGRTDIVVVRSDRWWIRSDGTVLADLARPPTTSGLPAVPVPADYDGDGRAEPAWHRGADATWFVNGQTPVQFGAGASDVSPGSPGAYDARHVDYDAPVPADYDGDRKADLASYSPRTGAWRVRSSRDGTVSTAVLKTPDLDLQLPAPGDYDGVGHAQRAVLDFNGWTIEGRGAPVPITRSPGLSPSDSTIMPTPADYDGDRRLDLSNLEWRVGSATAAWRFSGSANVVNLSEQQYLTARPAAFDTKLLYSIARFTLIARCQRDPVPC
jgi:hypothetical protein